MKSEFLLKNSRKRGNLLFPFPKRRFAALARSLGGREPTSLRCRPSQV